MEGILDFLAVNYIWFFVLAGVFLIALIGYLLDGKKKASVDKANETLETISVNNNVVSPELPKTVETTNQVEESTSTPTNETLSVETAAPQETNTESKAENTDNNTTVNDEPAIVIPAPSEDTTKKDSDVEVL